MRLALAVIVALLHHALVALARLVAWGVRRGRGRGVGIEWRPPEVRLLARPEITRLVLRPQSRGA